MKKPLIILSVIIFSLVSCSTDNNNNNNNESTSISHLVKREYVSNNVNIEYRYNENGHLTRIFDIDNQEDIDDVINYTYDSNNIVTKNFESNNSNYSAITNYSFNGNNKLLNAISSINQPNLPFNPTNVINQEFTYNNNIITVDISSSTEQSRTVILEVNNLGLITKMIESEFYLVVSYDTNENISEIKKYYNNDILLSTTVYEYDNNPNPFYGQLKSLYLPMFIDSLEDDFYWDGYLGYDFPFLKNNITSITIDGSLDRNYYYLYDNENYPINVIEEFNGINSHEFDIEYE